MIRLAAGSRFVDFDTEVEWHETNRLLKVAFPVDVRSLRATYEIQYGHVERPTHANTSWDVARFEVCAHKWADLSEPGYGVALLNDCKYGYDIAGNVIRLSLLRAPTWPDPVADRGHHRFTYRLLPHAGDLRDAGVIDAGYDLNVPLRAIVASPRSGSPTSEAAGTRNDGRSMLSVDAPNVVVEVVKRSDDDPDVLVVRMYDAWGRRGPVTVRTPWTYPPRLVDGPAGTGDRRRPEQRESAHARRGPVPDRDPEARAGLKRDLTASRAGATTGSGVAVFGIGVCVRRRPTLAGDPQRLGSVLFRAGSQPSGSSQVVALAESTSRGHATS